MKLWIAGLLRSWAERLDPSEPNYGYTYTFTGSFAGVDYVGPAKTSVSV